MIGVFTGPRHSGKTTRLAALCREWRGAGRSVDGFLSPALRTSRAVRDEAEGPGGRDDFPVGYNLLEIKQGSERPFLRLAGSAADGAGFDDGGHARAAGARYGRWIFVPDGLARAVEIIRCASPDDLLVVDEFGPLEFRGGGLRPAFDEALRASGRRVLVVVREALWRAFLESYSEFGPKTYHALQPGAGEDLTRDFFGEAG